MSKKHAREGTWLDGAQGAWRKIDTLYAKIVAASERGDRNERRRLRRRLLYAIHTAQRKAHYQGRLLLALGEAILTPDQRVKTLLASFRVSKKEGDFYNCLLTADSLAKFFVEWRYQPAQAHQWIVESRRLLKRFADSDIRRNVLLLSRRIGGSSRPS